ncbi:nucleotidyltransferase family protein [Pinibacter aurantiacus]|uniref:Nucleotidyltransferase domain-containing protein n=1 Tax=Pinibacter aurantiacus TaxID=2851599 RepID=A0A9E2S680_9BACT|nr:nucleotidyltransferase domain-containing protein [Pinibacter aurantiacus]MBV4357413.1 nucleotidyltransferase domain-containing protein [Pinibacter aurantiacus]
MSYLTNIQNSLQKLKPILVNKYHVSTIGLFGSVVRNDYSDLKSDIDIIVDFSEPIGIEFIDMADLIEKELKKKVDVVSKRGIKEKYFSQIQDEIVYV